MENLEFLTEKRKLRKNLDDVNHENKNLYLLLAKLQMDREEEKKNLLLKLRNTIITMAVEKMGLRVEHLKDHVERHRTDSRILGFFREIIHTTFGAGIPVNDYVVIPREAFVKAAKVISTFETKIDDLFPGPRNKEVI